MRRRWIGLALGVALGALLLQATLVLNAAPMRPLRVEPVAADGSSAPVDEHLETARLYAPWIYHETSEALGRQDIPAAIDFDGDLVATNNWESFPRFALVPTVYYTYAETRTHIFLSYHLYHPRDWSQVMLGLHETHEGDGENVQVVVDKVNATPVLLTTQAHFDAWSYAPVGGPIRSGDESLRADFEIFTGHPIVYVESGGHGIYGGRDPRAANRLARVGDPIVSYRPAGEDDVVAEPVSWNDTVPYRLVSLPAFLDNATAHPALFAGYEDGGVPRYHQGDRYSGPLGNSRGISPFALGYSWRDGEFSDLFFEPAETYARELDIRGAWSTEYVVRPFSRDRAGGPVDEGRG